MSCFSAEEAPARLSLGSQHKRILRLQFPRGDAPRKALLANKLDAFEGLSRDFRYRVELLSSDPGIAPQDMLGKMACVEVVREDASLRYFNGYVVEFRFVRTDGGFCHYEMVLGPWMSLLKLRRDNRLFHHANVMSQTLRILRDCRDADWTSQYLGADAEMNDACQFDESAHNYLHRRWEERGWHYWYEHRADGHTLVLSGDSYGCQPIDGETSDIPWQTEAGAMEDDGIARFSPVRAV
ncbi:MAG TPA: type VI secretion system Vgr family protein, partial [Variovorax sp.]|nr:type VI secretion system Vgr family protein [Variovorax sp.]